MSTMVSSVEYFELLYIGWTLHYVQDYECTFRVLCFSLSQLYRETHRLQSSLPQV